MGVRFSHPLLLFKAETLIMNSVLVLFLFSENKRNMKGTIDSIVKIIGTRV